MYSWKYRDKNYFKDSTLPMIFHLSRIIILELIEFYKLKTDEYIFISYIARTLISLIV